MKQFRSYADTEIVLGDRTFIVGRNAAGKSNLLDALALLSEMASEPLVTILDRRGGLGAVRRRLGRPGAPPEMYLDADVDLPGGKGKFTAWLKAGRGYGFKVDAENCTVTDVDGVQHTIRRRENFIGENTTGLYPKMSGEALLLPLIGGIVPFDGLVDALKGIRIYAIDPLRMKEPQVPDDGAILSRDGSNAASVIREMRKTDVWPRVLEFFQAAVPQIKDAEPVREGAKLALSFLQKGENGETVRFPGFQASDGTLRILGILLALLQQPSPMLVALEEPEVNVHPGALGVLLDAIHYASAQTQVVVTTQSPDLLDADWIEPEDIRIVEWQGGISKVVGLSAGATDVLKRHLRTPGELLRAGALESSL